jgi:putative hemolysin
VIDASVLPRFATRLGGLDALTSLYGELRATGDREGIFDRLLTRLRVSYRVSERDLAHVPRSGATIVVANHPCGMLEGALFASVLKRIRPDTKILANELLAGIPELEELVIPVDVFQRGARGNVSAVSRCVEHLRGGGLLVVFPAGAVAHFQWRRRSVADPEWQPGVCRMVSLLERQGSAVNVVPAHVTGRNSGLFYLAGLLHPRLRTLLLPRELLNKHEATAEIRIGAAVAGNKLLEIAGDTERTQYLRWRSDVLGTRNQFKARTALPLLTRERTKSAAAPADAVDPSVLDAEIDALGQSSVLASNGALWAYIATADRVPNVLAEIGRLRELTFRAAGEGSGKASDIDTFDAYYLHLFVWDREQRKIVGAYRLAETDWLARERGVRGLYTASLFHFGEQFLRELGPAIELGRSFVRPEYQRGFAPLLLLWKAIGAWIAAHPQYKTLFGPVSISAAYSAPARELMVSFLERHAAFAGLMRFVKAKNPLRRSDAAVVPEAARHIEHLSTAVADLESAEVGVPVLLRHYLKLGGKLLAFSVDPLFSDALDGLIVVDLTKTPPKLLERYLGKAESARFLQYQKGKHGTVQSCSRR